MGTKYLITVVGPTAIGKTALSIKLATYFNTEILSADSRQFFMEMKIGTSAPTITEMAAAKHHFIHHKSVIENYNVGDYEKDAIALLDDLFKNKDIVMMVGGSGLYVDAVNYGLDDFPKIDPNIRAKLNQQLELEGLKSLQQHLKLLDANSYNNIAIDNPHRVIRALEVCIGTNLPYSSFLNKKKTERGFESIIIGLTAERNIVYERINRRVDLMMEEDLLDEVKKLAPQQHLNALNTVGYKELFKYLNGDCSLDFAIEEIKKNSRRFAKRQLTWLNKDKNILWFNYDIDFQKIVKSINSQMDIESD